MPFLPKGFEWIIILVVALLIFGPKNLPKLGAAFGKTVKNLREGLGDGSKDKEEEEQAAEAEVVEEAPKKRVVKKIVETDEEGGAVTSDQKEE
jgi:sec-independent protein translocase protein TatA